jgi:alanyl-tRNA synthetase
MIMNTNDIRQKYLDFFRNKGHAIIPSAPLVPENDPSVLFNTAGMQPLVPYLLGKPHPMGKRIADVQKCVRTVDIDNVGDDSHLTFFEMLGNWSLGDYFKKESITWSWEFLTDPLWLGLDPKMISVTVFEGDKNAPRDDESAEIWKSLGIPTERIAYLPADDNWWAAGATGPCGPDTEIFYWVGEGVPEGNKKNHPNQWMEIWNNVFMQYNRVDAETLEKLPAPCVDTGMGLERTTVTLNGMKSVYETDAFADVLDAIRNIVGAAKYVERRARIIADHLRAAVHIIADGVVPKNVEQGYILRRLIRRSIREFYNMGYEKPVIANIAKLFINKFDNIYESIKNNKEKIIVELNIEETKFRETLVRGLKEFEKRLATGVITGKDAFELFSTYGFPLEMTKEMTEENKMVINEKEFQEEFSKHQELSRQASKGKFKGGLADTSEMSVKYHTATHLLQQALREVLGSGVFQKGSNITPERLRFDFSYPQKMTEEEKQAVEIIVNQKIIAKLPVSYEDLPIEEARKLGAIGLFDEKYGEKVRVYRIGDSVEFCGGPHISNTGELGHFKIVKEEASSAGVRRIKAILE